MLWLFSCALISDADRKARMDADDDGWEVPADCDDSSDEVFPSRVELCNGSDDDCDGNIDEGLDQSTWYVDGDGDGFGIDESVEACEQPEGYVDNDLDCDDLDPEVRPDAEEICGDGVDNNCIDDGDVCRLQGELSYLDADAVLQGDSESGAAGWALRWIPGLDDTPDSLVVGAPAREDFAGTVYLVTRVESGQNLLEDQPVRIRGDEGMLLGFAVDFVPALDGEGPELLIGAPGTDLDSGRVYRADTPVGGTVPVDGMDYIYGSSKGATLGAAVLGCPDLTGDALADVALGAPVASMGIGSAEPGRVSVHDAAFTGAVRDGDATALITDDNATTLFGTALGAADADGDGQPDLLVGAPTDSEAALAGGSISVFYGPLSGSFSIEDRDAVVLASFPGDNLGSALDASGDLNLDGYRDLLVGASGSSVGEERAGAAALFTGPINTAEVELTDALVLVRGEQGRAGASCAQCVGGSIAFAGDIDQDAFGDVLIGAGRYDFNGPQGDDDSAALFYGGSGLAGTYDYSDADLLIEGARNSYFGGKVGSAGDMNVDGITDLAVGAIGQGNGGVEGAGAVFLFWGSAP